VTDFEHCRRSSLSVPGLYLILHPGAPHPISAISHFFRIILAIAIVSLLRIYDFVTKSVGGKLQDDDGGADLLVAFELLDDTLDSSFRNAGAVSALPVFQPSHE
jgi:hypothetical protein